MQEVTKYLNIKEIDLLGLKRTQQKITDSSKSLLKIISLYVYLKKVVGLPDIALEGGATGVKPWPVGVGEVSVREEVITLGRPGFVGPIQLVQVTAGCGVQQVHLAALLLLFIINIKYVQFLHAYCNSSFAHPTLISPSNAKFSNRRVNFKTNIGKGKVLNIP